MAQNEIIQHYYPDSSRIGQFNVMFEVLRDGRNRPMLQALFGLCVVLSTEPHESGRGTTYIAASELFEPLEEGAEIPNYRIDFTHSGKPFPQPDHEAKKIVATGGFAFVAIRNNIIRVPTAQLKTVGAIPGGKPKPH